MPILNSFINIELDERKDVFLFCSYDDDKKLRIVLLDVDGCKAYSGCATDIDLRSLAAMIKMTFSDFINLSAKAFTKNETEGNKFLFSLDRNCENFMFRWKSIDQEETVIIIGSMKVEENQYSLAIKEVFMMLSNDLSNLNSKVSSMEEKLLTIAKEKEDAVKLASEMTDIKDKIETELFSKFILVLNEKKEKIRNLQKHKNSSDLNPVSKRTKTTKVKRLHQISDSSDEAVSDLEKNDVMKPSTSKHNVSLPFLDDDDNEHPILPSPSKRRIRQNNSVAKKAVSKDHGHREKPKIIVKSESEDELLLNL